jgi:hypothetical protein
MSTISKTAHQLRTGDLVHFHGSVFRIANDPVESQAHRPEGYWPAAGVGPSDCTHCKGICLEGEVPGYFKPGAEWSFQGNTRARFAVVAD